eukprot:gb/GECH01011114.1/.p1 GENE.gb/GECH01011114.1/~~gb/GECH01011114.1/.p1  ORF type:complete len:309 (+),score=77.20 gb/GECH01011114.1/:1-927(+)
MARITEKKRAYVARFAEYVENYKRMLIVNVDNVRSKQMQQVRHSLRGRAVLLMGKNTLMKKAVQTLTEDYPQLAEIRPLIEGNIGFIFTNEDPAEIREIAESNKVGAPAKPGVVSPINITVPAGNTGQEPGKTAFFQALNIPTKITRGTVEITSNVDILLAGEKVGNSEATLLSMLNILPFSFGIKAEWIYDDGELYNAKILDITDDDLKDRMMTGINNIGGLSLAINHPTQASVPHSIINGFKNLMAFCVADDVEYTIEEAKEFKEFVRNPDAFAAAAPAKEESKKEEEEEEEEEESDDDMGFGLFD